MYFYSLSQSEGSSSTKQSASLSNFKIWPFVNCSSFSECPTSLSSRAVPRNLLPDGMAVLLTSTDACTHVATLKGSPDDFASPGYFATNLSTSVRVELTATRRTALHRYTFPPDSIEPRLLVDLTDDGLRSGYAVTLLIDPITSRVTGDAWFSGSFGPGKYHLFTCVDFSGEGYNLGSPTEYGSWAINRVTQNATDLNGTYSGPSGALLTFQPAPSGASSILVRVGVSFISSAQACANAEEEISDWDFERVHSSALAEWNELLGRVQVDPTGVDKETLQLFYSSVS